MVLSFSRETSHSVLIIVAFFISDRGVNLRGCCCYFLSFNGVAMRDWLMRFEVVTVSSHTIFRSISALLFSALLFLIVFALKASNLYDFYVDGTIF